MHRSIKNLFSLLLLIALIAGASTAFAQPVASNCRFPSHITVCPSGDIHVQGVIRDINNNPINWGITMEFGGPALNSLYHAPGYNWPAADMVSQNGIVTWDPKVGGCELGGGVRYFDGLNGTFLGSTAIITSPDLNGDGSVNLGDVVILAAAMGGPYNPCMDFTGDGLINLSDVVVFATHYGH